MAAKSGNRTIVLAVVAAVVVAGLGYWGYNAYQKRELRVAVVAILKGTSERVRDALALQAGALPDDRAGPIKRVEGHSAAVDKAFDQMRRLQVQRDRALTDEADGYLVTAREMLRAQARMYRLYQRQDQSLDALRDHMRVDDRRGAWVTSAVRHKERAERDFRDYRLANAAYATLLGSLPDSQKKIETAVGREALAPADQITRAREKALATAQAAADEMEKLRQLVGPK